MTIQTFTNTQTVQMIQFTGTHESAKEIEDFVSSKVWARNEYDGLKPLTYTPPVVSWKRLNTDTFVHIFLNKVFPSRVKNSETYAEYQARKKRTQNTYDEWFLSQTAIEIVTGTDAIRMTTGKWLVFDNNGKFSVLRDVTGFSQEPDLNDPVALDKAINELYAKLEVYIDLREAMNGVAATL